jgi:hypothetical protein
LKIIDSASWIHGVLLTLLLASGVIAQDEPGAGTVTAPELRDELLARIEIDQDARFAAIEWDADHGQDGIVNESMLTEKDRQARADLGAEIARIDAENTAWMKQVVGDRGWFTYSDVGAEATDAAWLLVQHADDDPEFQRLCLDLMSALSANEVSQTNVALLTDRVRIKEGKKQLYGSQFVIRNDEWVPLEIEDEENVDARREAVGLPPMSEYKSMLQAVMRGDEIE